VVSGRNEKAGQAMTRRERAREGRTRQRELKPSTLLKKHQKRAGTPNRRGQEEEEEEAVVVWEGKE